LKVRIRKYLIKNEYKMTRIKHITKAIIDFNLLSATNSVVRFLIHMN